MVPEVSVFQGFFAEKVRRAICQYAHRLTLCSTTFFGHLGMPHGTSTLKSMPVYRGLFSPDHLHDEDLHATQIIFDTYLGILRTSYQSPEETKNGAIGGMRLRKHPYISITWAVTASEFSLNCIERCNGVVAEANATAPFNTKTIKDTLKWKQR